ncbi:MAG: hypothetical protein K9J06_08985 [Flavobacteriales bacterium]|nr:hypothetical protein [Flavobacteriales bacterium]
METLVYFMARTFKDHVHNANAIRTGLLMSPMTFAVGNAYINILYKPVTETLYKTLAEKLKLLENHPDFNQLSTTNMLKNMQHLWKNRRNPNALKQYKIHEHFINQTFNKYIAALQEGIDSFSMTQLAALNGDDVLTVFATHDNPGEKYESDFRLSDLLKLKRSSNSLHGPYVFSLTGKLDQLPPEDEAGLVHLFTLPNINPLTAGQLLSVRKSLDPSMERLRQQLVRDCPSEEPPRYGGGRWNKTTLPSIGSAIQEVINASPDLQWAAVLNPNVKTNVLVGEMDTHRFWQLQRDCDQVPDDSWEVLQALPADEPYPRTIPIVVIRVIGQLAEEAITDQDAILQHRRKTISLD